MIAHKAAFLKSYTGRYLAAAFFLISLLCTLCLGCQSADTFRRQDTLGLSVPLTGSLAYLGKNILRGVNLYLDEHPELKKEVRVVVEDSFTTEPIRGVAGARKLIDVDNANVLIMGSSQVLEATKAHIERKKIVTFGIVGTDALKDFRYGLKHWVSADSEAAGLVSQMQAQKLQSLVVLVSESPAFAMREAALRKGLEMTLPGLSARYERIAALDEIPTVATKVARDAPDAVALLLLPGPVGEMAKSLRELGYAGKFYATISATDAGEVAASGGALIGTEYVDVNLQPEFAERYQRQFREHVGLGIANGYDIMAILAQARQKLGSWQDADALNAAVRVKDFRGVMGTYSFAAEHNNTFDFPVVAKTVVALPQ